MNNNNSNEKINDNEMWRCIDYSGPHTVMHHQYFQMVDLLMHYVQRSMSGLNPHASPYVPHHQQAQINKLNEKLEEKKKKTSDQPNMCKEKNDTQGWKMCTNKKQKKRTKNEQPEIVQTAIDGNRFSFLKNMVGENAEVTQLLQKAVEKQNKNESNESKVRETTSNRTTFVLLK